MKRRRRRARERRTPKVAKGRKRWGQNADWRRWRSCDRKVRYPSRWHAQQAIRDVYEEGGPLLKIYRCRYCKGHHGTKA